MENAISRQRLATARLLIPDFFHDQATSEGLGKERKGSSRRWGRNYDNRELFPLFGVSDYESLLVKLAEIGVRTRRGTG